MKRRAASAGAIAAALLACAPARAEPGDGIYGRFDGDLELRAHAGAAFAAGGPAFAASLSALYLSTAGIYAHYTDAFGAGGPRVLRSVSGGVHFAPFFLARTAVNAQRGPAFSDLLIDSFAFELGAVWSKPRDKEPDDTPGMEAALGLAVPLFARATGLFIGVRAALRWRPGDFAAGPPSSVADRGGLLSLTLGWHHVLRTHLVDVGDRVRP